MEKPYDGVAELWWTNRDALAASFGSVAGQVAGKELLEDEARFIDLPNSPLWLAYEYPQVNPTPEHVVAHPASRTLKLHFPLRHVTTMSTAAAQEYWRVQHGPLIRALAPAMGLTRYLQVHRVE